MTLTELKKLIAGGESDTLEFKKSTSKLKSGAETLCAFLNNHEGRVVFGVSDNGTLLGQDVTDNTKQEIDNTLRKFEPTANIDTKFIKLKTGKQIIVLTAHPDVRCVPYTFDGRAYERKQASTHIMPQRSISSC